MQEGTSGTESVVSECAVAAFQCQQRRGLTVQSSTLCHQSYRTVKLKSKWLVFVNQVV